MATQVPERTMSTIALMVTRRCNMACAHCSVASSSRIREQPSEAELVQVVHDAADAGVKAIIFTGGEPMIREKLVVRLMSIAKRRGLVSAMTTNGFWGKTLPDARRTLGSLCKAGLSLLTLSYDRYHAEFQGPEPGQNILRAAKETGIPLNLNVTRVADDSEIGDLVRPFEASNYANVRLYDVQPVGRALDLPSSSLRAEVEGACDGARVPTVTDNGRVTACNGPAYFQTDDSPLVMGRLEKASLKSMIEKHRDDPILQTIRIFGPSKLRYELSRISGFEDFPWKSSYAGLCDLCLHINSDSAAATALRARLSDPKLVAERAARSL
ncbi:MAG TPA: radical SAM protein, partial [Gemmatimonadaceae bacterium]|nr:radical SAM protein [Gemmatimonadaceae bacterium]